MLSSIKSDSEGCWSLTAPKVGSYKLKIVLPKGYKPSAGLPTRTVTVTGAGVRANFPLRK